MICLNGTSVDLDSRFADGTYALKLNEETVDELSSLGNNDAIYILWKYDGEFEFPALFYIVSHLREHYSHKIILSLPYVPNARMDRVKHVGEIFTLKYFTAFINSLRLDSVRIFDPHSNVSVALFDRVEVVQPDEFIRMVIRDIRRDDLLVFFPDEGAVKRYAEYAGKPFIYGEKQRDWDTGAILGLNVVMDNIGDITGRPILMIDDICSHGSTFYHSAMALRERGAGDIYIYCSHCENTIFEGSLLTAQNLIKHIYTTNSILRIKQYDGRFTIFHLV